MTVASTTPIGVVVAGVSIVVSVLCPLVLKVEMV